MELAVGMFALALVVSALCGFAVILARSLEVQNVLRRGEGTGARTETVELDDFSADWIFGTGVWKIEARVKLPSRTILK